MKLDCKNWIPKGMLFSLIAGTMLSLAFGIFGVCVSGKLCVVLGVVFGIAFVVCAKYSEWCIYAYRDTHPSTLSGGQKQRLAIACAIFSGRRILILDEPTSGLDGQNMRLIEERLKSEALNGRTVLVITHDRELIESCCDNVVEVGTKPSEVQ